MALDARKAALRREVRSRVAAMPAREVANARIVDILRRVLVGRGLVLSYMALPDEVDLGALNVWLAVHGRLLLPRVGADGLTIHYVESLQAELETGSFGILEPCTAIDSRHPETVLVPGRAFDHAGGRLGRGGGYYDRALAGWPSARRVGVAYAVQRLDVLPMGPHDVPMHALVTEEGYVDA